MFSFIIFYNSSRHSSPTTDHSYYQRSSTTTDKAAAVTKAAIDSASALNGQLLNYSLNRSLEEQPSLEKNKEEIEVESVKYETIVEKKEKKCCICLADFLNDEDVSLIKCEHLFHSSCIKEWSTYNITCPVCRKNLKD